MSQSTGLFYIIIGFIRYTFIVSENDFHILKKKKIEVNFISTVFSDVVSGMFRGLVFGWTLRGLTNGFLQLWLAVLVF